MLNLYHQLLAQHTIVLEFFMTALHGIKLAITKLCQERCLNSGSFDEFTARLSDIGIVRQTYDVIKNELLFYSNNQHLLTLAMSEVDTSSDIYPFPIGDALNLDAVKKAIMAFDAGIISSATQFHKEIALAGIIYVSVHLVPRKIYYLSQDAQYYLESY